MSGAIRKALHNWTNWAHLEKEDRPQIIGHEKGSRDRMARAKVEERMESSKNKFAHYIILMKAVLVFINVIYEWKRENNTSKFSLNNFWQAVLGVLVSTSAWFWLLHKKKCPFNFCVFFWMGHTWHHVHGILHVQRTKSIIFSRSNEIREREPNL